MHNKFIAAMTGIVMFGAGSAAQAATVVDNFSFTDSSNAVIASGSFGYDSGLSGTLSYADLSSFTISVLGSAYNLSFVNSLSSDPGAYVYFGFNTLSNSFVSASVPGSVGNYSGIFAAVNGALNNGFFIDPLVGQADPAHTGADGVVAQYAGYPGYGNQATISGYSVTAVPGPIAGAGLPALLGILGFGLYRRRRSVNVA
jgi:hypothetical protein